MRLLVGIDKPEPAVNQSKGTTFLRSSLFFVKGTLAAKEQGITKSAFVDLEKGGPGSGRHPGDSNIIDPQKKIESVKKFERIINLRMDKWTDEDWRAHDKFYETGKVPAFAEKRLTAMERLKQRRSDEMVKRHARKGNSSYRDKSIIIDLEKAQRSREGLIPIKKEVTRANGTSYIAVYWVRPKDLRKMQFENATTFMAGMVRAQQHFKSILDKVEKELPDAAAAVREKLAATGQQLTRIGQLQIELAEHSKQNPVSGDQLLAAIHTRSEAEIPEKVKNIINRLYKDVTTETYGEALKIGGEEIKTTALRTSEAKRTYSWEPGKWQDKLKDIMTRKVQEVGTLLGIRKKQGSGADVPKEDDVESKKRLTATKLRQVTEEGKKSMMEKLKHVIKRTGMPKMEVKTGNPPEESPKKPSKQAPRLRESPQERSTGSGKGKLPPKDAKPVLARSTKTKLERSKAKTVTLDSGQRMQVKKYMGGLLFKYEDAPDKPESWNLAKRAMEKRIQDGIDAEKIARRKKRVKKETEKSIALYVNVKKAWSSEARAAAARARRRSNKGTITHSGKYHHVEHQLGEHLPYAVFRTHDRELFGTAKDRASAKLLMEAADTMKLKAVVVDIEKSRENLVPRMQQTKRGHSQVYYVRADELKEHVERLKKDYPDKKVYVQVHKYKEDAETKEGQPMKPETLLVVRHEAGDKKSVDRESVRKKMFGFMERAKA